MNSYEPTSVLEFHKAQGFWTLLSWPLLMCLCLSYHFGDVFEAHGSDQFALDLIRISNPLEWIGIRVGKCWFLDTDVATSLYGPGYYAIAGCATPNNATDRACGPNGPADPRWTEVFLRDTSRVCFRYATHWGWNKSSNYIHIYFQNLEYDVGSWWAFLIALKVGDPWWSE